MRSCGRAWSLQRDPAASICNSRGCSAVDHIVHLTICGPCAERMIMKTEQSEMGVFQEMLERQEAELVGVLRKREGITIEKSADQMDEIQYATERDLAIRNVDRDSRLLQQIRAALRRIREDCFGTCI